MCKPSNTWHSIAMATSLVPRLATLRESGDESNGFPPGNEAEDRQSASERFYPSGVNFCGCLRHKRLKRVEFIRVIRWQWLRELSVFREDKGQKKIHRNISKRSLI